MENPNIEKTMESFKTRGIDAHYFPTAAEALDYLAGEIQNTTVGFGGSVTVRDMAFMRGWRRTTPFSGTGKAGTPPSCAKRRLTARYS
jgi:hypothetical protein